MQSIAYTVKTDVFEGPLELLLQLVEKRKLFINDISLAEVADDYVSYIREHEEFPLGDAASFVYIASVLVLIKSHSLLPDLEVTEEEEGSMEDLERRLKAYKRFKDISQQVSTLLRAKEAIYPRVHVSKHLSPVFTPDKHITKASMYEAVLSSMKKVPRPEKHEKRTLRTVVSIEEMIDRLTTRISRGISGTFSEFSNIDKGERITVVVSFLAVLELVKQGAVIVRQEQVFSDIYLEPPQQN